MLISINCGQEYPKEDVLGMAGWLGAVPTSSHAMPACASLRQRPLVIRAVICGLWHSVGTQALLLSGTTGANKYPTHSPECPPGKGALMLLWQGVNAKGLDGTGGSSQGRCDGWPGLVCLVLLA